MLDSMDGTILQTVGLIVLGWLVLAVLVSAGLAVFLGGAHQLERELPTQNLLRERNPHAHPRSQLG
jgi:hypothetical protein